MITLVDVLNRTTTFFQQKGIGTPRLDAQLIMAHVLKLERIALYVNFDRPMSEPELDQIRGFVRRRGEREPLAWILGVKEFYGRDFEVGLGVLVPRPDTETLIEALKPQVAGFVADVGSGSGIIGITLALEHPELRVYCVETSPEALAYTRRNVERHGVQERVAVLGGRDLEPVPAKRQVDWVVSNPPYIPDGEIAGLAPEVSRHEPKLALAGGRDGLEMYRRLIPKGMARARVGLALEVGAGQAGVVAAMCAPWEVAVHRDLAGVERVIVARRPTG